MNGGKIIDNQAIPDEDGSSDEVGNGGGVYVDDDGIFTMTGGTITGNTATSADNTTSGGGVYVSYTGIFNETGGSVTGNPGSNVIRCADISEELELEPDLH
jgi:hypothetical protein